MCCFREAKNFDRYARLIHHIVLCTLQQLQDLQQELQIAAEKRNENEASDDNGDETVDKDKKKEEEEKTQNVESPRSQLNWSNQAREKLFHLLSKTFLLNFPLYIAIKHGGPICTLGPVKVIYIIYKYTV